MKNKKMGECKMSVELSEFYKERIKRLEAEKKCLEMELKNKEDLINSLRNQLAYKPITVPYYGETTITCGPNGIAVGGPNETFF
jgi:hypothetical protein